MPLKLVQNIRASTPYERVAYPSTREVRYPVAAVQVPDLALPVVERGSSEPARRSGYAGPAKYLLLDGQC